MSRKTRIWISCFLVVLAFAAGILTYLHANGNRAEVANAEGSVQYFVDAEGKIKIPVEPMAGSTVTEEERDENRKTRGTEGNPFFILEIAPYEGEGQFGYQIAGCEPVDVDLLAWDGLNVYGEGDLYEVITDGTGVCYFWEKDYSAKYTGATEGTTTQYGTMVKVSDGTGTHKLSDDGTKLEPEEGGAYRWEPLSVEECLEIVDDETLKKEYEESVYEGDSFKAYFEDAKYFYKNGVKKYVHNNYFLRESVGLAYDKYSDHREKVSEDIIAERIANYHVELYTVTPEDLNQNLELIDRADLITIVTKDNTSNARNNYERNSGYYLREGKFTRADSDKAKKVENKSGATFVTNQLSWEAAVRIYNRVNDDKKPCPLLWDSQTYADITADSTLTEFSYEVKVANDKKKNITAKGTQNNLFKLYLMLYHMPSTTLEALFGDPQDFGSTQMSGYEDKNGKVNTGLLDLYTKGEANVYWSEFTFYPWAMLPDTNSSVYGPILDSFGIMNNSGEAMFGFASGGSQNFLRNCVYRNDGGTFFHSGFMKKSNVANDQYGHEVYDFFKSLNEDKSGSGVTSAECLYYLLNGFVTPAMKSNDKQYKVLELQPSPSYLSQDYWNVMYYTYAFTSTEPIVDQMTTSQFIGQNVDCLSEYDMVYIGMNKMSDDFTMHSNFTYAHTGPTVEIDGEYTVLHGWLGDDVDEKVQSTLAYSGNDLTKQKMTELKLYEQAGAALLFGNGFFTTANASTASGTIDRNSYIYELASGISGKLYEKALSDSSTHVATKMKLRAALDKSKRVEMTILKHPNLYVEGNSDSEKYINGSDITNRLLEYKFSLSAPAGKSYSVALYIDINGDGKFVKEENVGNTIYDESGKSVSTVKNGKTYTVRRRVEDRIGSVSWKLDIVSGSTVYDSISGVSAIKANANGTEDVELCILQIIPAERVDGVSSDQPVCTVYLPQEGEVNGDQVTGLPAEATKEMKEVTKRFYELCQEINGMKITFVRKTQDEVSAALATNSNYLKHTYDMIIIGFADVYQGITLLDVSSAITDFIGSGRAVLFTHDTASLIGPGGEGVSAYYAGNLSWGKNYTKAYRDIFGMDRYDVLKYGGAKNADRDDHPYLATDDSDKKGKETTKNDVVLAQGFSNSIIHRYKTVNGNVSSTKVVQINTGAITEYPYKISESIEVAETHTQYYQLDMERSDIVVWYCLGEAGKVAPAGSKEPKPKDAKEPSGGDASVSEYYKATPGDVRNNYYIYNAGNVTYSGVGHSSNLTDDEIKLFVNTFVAAYRAAAKPVDILIVNDDATRDASSKYYLCVDVDSSDTKTAFGNDIVEQYQTQKESGENTGTFELDKTVTAQSKRVYFRIKNNGTSKDPEYTLTFSVNGSETPLAVFRKPEEDEAPVFMSQKTSSTKFVASEFEIYYVDVPLTIDTNPSTGKEAIGSTSLEIKVVMIYGDERYKSDPAFVPVDILPRGLFDLD